MAILPDLTQATREELIAQIEAMRARKANRVTFKITDGAISKKTNKPTSKGALSVYGLGQFPVTLYRSQWERLLSAADEIAAYIEAHSAELTVKA